VQEAAKYSWGEAGDIVDHPQKNPSGLSRDQAAALHLYTSEVVYVELNDKLRQKDRTAAKPFLGFVALVMSAAKKLPKEEAIVYRGVDVDLYDELSRKKGEETTWWHFASCTIDIGTLLQFAGSPSQHGTVLVLATKSAVDIRAFSAYPQEKELLLLPGAVLEIQQVVRNVGERRTQAMLKENSHVFLMPATKPAALPPPPSSSPAGATSSAGGGGGALSPPSSSPASSPSAPAQAVIPPTTSSVPLPPSSSIPAPSPAAAAQAVIPPTPSSVAVAAGMAMVRSGGRKGRRGAGRKRYLRA
jgi:hypothetical protein